MKRQLKAPLFQALVEHISKNSVSFHVPGHKNGHVIPKGAEIFQQILQIDATELSDLDDLHSPEGVILEAEVLLAELFQVQKSFFLVNGSTSGNLAMVMSVCTEGDVVLVQRNCHKSVMNALRLAKVTPVFLEPEFNKDWKVATGVDYETVKQAIGRYPQAKALIVTYPNYYGMVYDLQAVIDHCHLHHIPVLVDEAHGAHFISNSQFPVSAVKMGADIVVQSAHKTLPAMTMGSFLHFNSELLSLERLEDYLHIFQSSSPSYPIMASLDLARSYLAGYEKKDGLFLLNQVNRFKRELAAIPGIKVLDYPESQGDFLKVTIQSACGLTGFELQKRLEREGIYSELADPYNVLFILPLLKENQTYPLMETAAKIKAALAGVPVQAVPEGLHRSGGKITELAISYLDMSKYKEGHVPIAEATNHVCAETVIPYPPGIPLLLIGERITNDTLQHVKRLIASGARFQGGASLDRGLIKVFLED